ncbi:DNA excision repair protein ERCC-1 [Anopheles ziemanni]|uniref:DNA excision repair protein ERCC-1 n=1 Tax=Anopheles coustani TaxID=139045 RepID=UPI002657DEF8|nr:DNA excision repair protein ERCC-1 [Anopheles coustani]XP_058172694.1 DNA excision repair protein ERCC-1 [Anopheles ziemanni]
MDEDDDLLASLEIPTVPKQAAVSQEKSPTSSTAASSNTTGVPTSSETPVIIAKVNKSNCILVNPKQRGNPLLKAIQNIPWEYDDIVPDYVVGASACVLFLSLRYHNLNPDYIHARLKLLGKMYELRVLLVQIDIQEPQNALKHLTRICLLADLTLMLAWNPEEAGRIVEKYKLFENRPPDWIMERAEKYPHEKIVRALTNIKPVNQTDAMILIQNYGTLGKLINTSEEKLSMCSGLGPRKVKKLHKTFNENFRK